jgi:hypothetical protein
MVKNVGPADRYIRTLAGIAILLNIIILEPGTLGSIVLLVLGGGLLFTAYINYCWLYDVLKISSCKETCEPAGEKAE